MTVTNDQCGHRNFITTTPIVTKMFISTSRVVSVQINITIFYCCSTTTDNNALASTVYGTIVHVKSAWNIDHNSATIAYIISIIFIAVCASKCRILKIYYYIIVI